MKEIDPLERKRKDLVVRGQTLSYPFYKRRNECL